MNKNLIKTFIFLALVLSIPLIAVSGKNSTAPVTTNHIQNMVVLPQVENQTVPFSQVDVQELSTKNAAVIQFNMEVTEDTVNRAIVEIRKANHKKGVSEIYLLLDSPGGSVFDGARLITAMDDSKVPVYTVCTELCASMAAEILEHGAKRYMVNRSTVMFHPASTTLFEAGEVDKLYSRLGAAKRFIDKLDMYVARRSGQTYDEFKAKSMREYWSDAQDALADHLIDGIVSIEFTKETPPKSDVGNEIKQDLKQLTLE